VVQSDHVRHPLKIAGTNRPAFPDCSKVVGMEVVARMASAETVFAVAVVVEVVARVVCCLHIAV